MTGGERSARRWRYGLGALLAGLLGLLWSLGALEVRLVEERAEALDALARSRRALSALATQALHDRLRVIIEERAPGIEAALADPLASEGGRLAFIDEIQRLPRRWRWRPGAETPALDTLSALREGGAEALAELEARRGGGASPWAERLALHQAISEALAHGSPEAIEATVRRWLGHRSRFVLPPAQAIPEALASLERLAADGRVDHALAQAALRDGLTSRQGTHLPGLQRALLHARDALTEADFKGLGERVTALSEAQGVPRADFSEALARRSREIPRPPERPSLDAEGCWLTAPRGREILGVRIKLQAILASIEGGLTAQGLLRETDRLRLPSSQGAACADRGPQSPYRGLPMVEIEGPRWAAAAQAHEDRLIYKSALVIACGLMGCVIVALAVSLQRRRRRYLALKSDFVATVSHELRTPLASMRLIAETLERRLSELPRVAYYPARLLKDIDGLDFLVENILSFNRLDRGRLVPRLELTPLEPLLTGLAVELAERFTPRAIELRQVGMEGARLTVDPALFRLLLTNLCRNACQYNERDPIEITVTLRATAGRWVIEIQDNGIGVPASERGRLFEAFERGEGSAGRRGSGLGLAICAQIMSVHRGSIEISASGPDGTTFTLSLPQGDR